MKTKKQDGRRRAPAAPGRDSGLPPPLAARLEATLDKVARAIVSPDAVEMVHDARKALKEYRALLRLIRSDTARAERRAAAEVARKLSGDRDRQAARDALDALVARKALAESEADGLRDALSRPAPGAVDEASAEDGRDHAAALRGWLTEARRRHAETLDAEASGVDLIEGVARGYAKARKEPGFSHPEQLHELRKRVVTHRYQMSFFADLADGRGARRAKRAQALRDTLGLIQDLETLKAALGDVPDLPEDLLERVSVCASAVQDELADDARGEHRSLFRRSPKGFRRHLEQGLGVRHGESGGPRRDGDAKATPG